MKIAESKETVRGIKEKIKTGCHRSLSISQTPFPLSSTDFKTDQYSIWRLTKRAVNPEYSKPKILNSGLEKRIRQSEKAR